MPGSKSQHQLTVEIAGKIASSFGSAIGNVNKQMSTLGKFAGKAAKLTAVGMAAAGTAVAGIAAASVNVGKSFEAQMSTVAAISGATGSEFAALEAKAKEMGATTQFSATEAGQAMEYMAMAGWKSSDMVDGISGIMNLAAASGEDLASTSDIVTDALTAFGMTAGQSGDFADVLAAASSNANTNVSMLGESFKYVAPLAGTLGYTAEDTSIALGLMANAGIKGSQAGTSLKTAIARMSAPTKAQAAAMKKLGLSLTDGEGNMKAMREVMADMRSSFAGLSESEQTAAASTIFGKEAMSGMLAIINASESDFSKLTAAIDNSSGAAAEMAAIRLDNLEGDITLLKSGLEGLGIEIYQGMNAPLREAAQMGAEYVAQLNAAFQEGGFSGMAGAVGDCLSQAVNAIVDYVPQVVSMGVDLISSFVQGITENADSLSDAAAETLAVFVDGLFELMPQILLAGIDIVTKLADSITRQLPILINNGTDAITNFVSGIIQRLPMIISTALTLVQTLVSSLGGNAPMLINAAIQLIGNLILGIVSMLPQLLQMGIQLILNLAQGIISNLPLILQMGVQVITNFISGITQMLPMIIQGGIQLIISLIQGIIGNLGNILQAGWELVGALVSGLLQSIPQILSATPKLIFAICDTIANTDWIQVGIDIIKGILSGIISMGGSIVDTVVGLFKGKTPDVSTSGTEIASSYASGINSNAGTVTAAVGSMATNAFSGADTSGAAAAGTAAATAYTTGMMDSFNGFTLDTSGVGLDSTALTTSLSAAGQESGAAFTAGLDSSISAYTFDTSGIGVGTAGLESSFTTAGAAGAKALSSGVTGNTEAVTAAATSLVTGVNTAFDTGWSTVQNSAETAMSTLTNMVQEKAQVAAKAVKSAFENMTIRVPRPQLPSVSVSYSAQGTGDAQVKVPQFSVSYHAKGGIMTEPTLFGMVGGEKGPEGIIPLNPFWDRLDSLHSDITAAVAGNAGGLSRASQDAVELAGMRSQVSDTDSRAKELYNQITNNSTKNISNDNSMAEISPQIMYSPQIIIQGNASKEDVQDALLMSQAEFNRMMDEYNWQNNRTAMAT